MEETYDLHLSGLTLVAALAKRGVACTALPTPTDPLSPHEYDWAAAPWRTAVPGSAGKYAPGGTGLVMRTGDGIDVIDFDPPPESELTVDNILALIAKWDIDPVAVVKTPSGVHVWILSPGLSCSSDTAAGIDYRGRGGCAHIPGSHRPKYSGRLGYEFVIAPRSVDAIPSTESIHGLMAEHGAKHLPAVAEQNPSSALLAAIAADFDSPRHRRFFQLTVLAKTEGLSEAATVTALAEWGVRTGKYPSVAKVATEITRIWPKINTNVGWREARPVSPVLRGIQGAVIAEVWGGRTGMADRTVLEAILRVCERAHRLRVNVSCRQLAELCGMSKVTASRAVRRLADAGWVKIHAASGRGCAQEVEVLPKDGGEVGLSTADLGHDSFRRGGLGKVARLLLECEIAGLTVRAIADTVGATPWQVRRALALLEEHGAAVRVGAAGNATLWTLQSAVDLDAVAESCGTAGRRDLAIAVHASERNVFRARAAEYASEQAAAVFDSMYADLDENLSSPTQPIEGYEYAGTIKSNADDSYSWVAGVLDVPA